MLVDQLNVVFGAEDRITPTAQNVKRSLGGLETAVLGVAAAWLSWEGAKKILDWTVASAIDAEQSWARVGHAIKNVGGEIESDLPKIKNLASALQNLSGQNDEAIGQMIATMLQYGMTVTQATATAGTALDFAIAKQLDLKTAADLVGRAFKGHTETLMRYGVVVPDVADETEKFAAVLDELRRIAGGAAEEHGNTAAGNIERLTANWEDLGESLGALVTPALNEVLDAINRQLNPLHEYRDIITDTTTESAKWAAALEGAYRRVTLAAMHDPSKLISIPGQNWEEYFATDEYKRIVGEMDDLDIWLSEQQAAELDKRVTATNDAYDAELAAQEAEADSAYNIMLSYTTRHRRLTEKQADDARQAAAQMGGYLRTFANIATDVLFGMETDTRVIFQRIGQAFIQLFIDQAIEALQKKFVVQFLESIALFDKRANDQMAMQQGRDFATYFTKGASDYMSSGNVASALSMTPRAQAGAGGGAMAGSQSLNLNFYGPVTSEQFVDQTLSPRIQRLSIMRRNLVSLQSLNATGGPDVRIR